MGLAMQHRQRGAAALILLAMMMVVMGVALMSAINHNTARYHARDALNTQALASAKAALLGYFIVHKTFPCPDVDNQGIAAPNSGSGCSPSIAQHDVYVGRLPWQTLGLAALKDGNNECLWYIISQNYTTDLSSQFAAITSASNASAPFNEQLLAKPVGDSLTTANSIGAVIAVGNAFPEQIRRADIQLPDCQATTPTTLLGSDLPHFFEQFTDNTLLTSTESSRQAPASDPQHNNDQASLIRFDEVHTLVKKRYCKENPGTTGC